MKGGEKVRLLRTRTRAGQRKQRKKEQEGKARRRLTSLHWRPRVVLLSYYIYISDAFTPADPRRILRLASHATTLFYRQRRHAKRALSPSRHVARRIASDGYDGNLRLWTLEKQSLRLLHEVDVDVAADSAGPIFSVALEALEDQGSILDGTDAVFLVGPTGVGKSLTLNFLAECEIAEVVDEDGFDHLDVAEADAPQRVSSVGHEVASKTKELRAFHDKISNLAFCDTPGFGDTEGVDSDLVNAVTITSAVRRPATVRLVVLISVKGLLAGAD